MARLKTFADLGAATPTDLNNMEDDYEFAFAVYKTFIRRNGAFPAASAVSQLLGVSSVLATGGTLTAALGETIFYFDPADWTVGSPNARTTQMRLRAECMIGGTAPAVTLTAGLYPVTFNTAGAAAFNTATLGTVVAGSTVAFASPGANTRTQSVSTVFTAPAAGWYAIGVAASAATAASSVSVIYAMLQQRNA